VFAACHWHHPVIQERVQLLLTQWDSCQFGILLWKGRSQYAHYPLSSQTSYILFSNLDLFWL